MWLLPFVPTVYPQWGRITFKMSYIESASLHQHIELSPFMFISHNLYILCPNKVYPEEAFSPPASWVIKFLIINIPSDV